MDIAGQCGGAWHAGLEHRAREAGMRSHIAPSSHPSHSHLLNCNHSTLDPGPRS